jgi:hypothetical protein
MLQYMYLNPYKYDFHRIVFVIKPVEYVSRTMWITKPSKCVLSHTSSIRSSNCVFVNLIFVLIQVVEGAPKFTWRFEVNIVISK